MRYYKFYTLILASFFLSFSIKAFAFSETDLSVYKKAFDWAEKNQWKNAYTTIEKAQIPLGKSCFNGGSLLIIPTPLLFPR